MVAYSSRSVLQDLVFSETKILFRWDHTDGVGVAHTATPALNADDVIALVDDTEFDTVRNTPLETAVDIFLPALEVEVGLLLGEIEWPDTTVKVGILLNALVSMSRD